MKYFICIFIWLSLFAPSKSVLASSGPDRCFIESCLCRVIPTHGGENTSAKQSRVFSIYFRENEYLLSEEQRVEIEKFLSEYKGRKTKASIVGYTDGCGSASHNKKLSLNRANEAFSLMTKYISPYNLEKIIGGEKSSHHTPFARRVDIIIHTTQRLTTQIEKTPSDYYLVDASGSMQSQYSKWNDIISASIKPGGKVFLSITEGCQDGQKMRNVGPRGGTEIWWSYWNIIDKMKPGETLLIISDFESQVPLSHREALLIKRKVSDAGIIVRSIRP